MQAAARAIGTIAIPVPKAVTTKSTSTPSKGGQLPLFVAFAATRVHRIGSGAVW